MHVVNSRGEIDQIINKTTLRPYRQIDKDINDAFLADDLEFLAFYDYRKVYLYQNQGTELSEIFFRDGERCALNSDQQYFLFYDYWEDELLIYTIPSMLELTQQLETSQSVSDITISQNNQWVAIDNEIYQFDGGTLIFFQDFDVYCVV